MKGDLSQAELASRDELRQIDDLVEDFARLADSDLSSRQFYAELIGRVVPALAAVAGAVWLRGPAGRLELQHQVGLAHTGLAADREHERRHALLMHEVLASQEPQLVPPQSGSGSETDAGNPTELVLVLCPLVVDRQSVGLLEIFQRADTSPAAQRGYLGFLTTMGDLAADFYRNRQLRELRGRESLWGELSQFSLDIHGKLDLHATAYAIVNEGRRVLGCDRVSLLVRRGRRYRLVAVSGVDALERRANSVRQLEQLVTLSLAADEPLWYTDGSSAPAPEIELPLQAYLDTSHARLLGVTPLLRSASPAADDRQLGQSPAEEQREQPMGALVVERFDAGADEGLRWRMSAVCGHSASALGAALEYQDLPLLWLARLLKQARWFTAARQLPKTTLALLAIAAATAALVLVPAEFNIEAPGALQPLVRREVFAPCDGVVGELRLPADKNVKSGEVLAVLQRPQLELEIQRVLGETQTAHKKLAAIEAARLEMDSVNSADRNRYQALTAEAEELKVTLTGLAAQRRILDRQQQELQIASPIAGQILTWDAAQLLESRPVARGESLLTVADVAGPWVLELRVADDRIGHVLLAQQESGDNLEVDFMLATEPGVTRHGRIRQAALATETHPGEQPAVLVTVEFDRAQFSQLRPGATAVAKIRCGERSLGYVWFHELWEAVQSRLLF